MSSIVAAVLALGAASSVHAANGNTPRTPVGFPVHACLAHVDRSVDPRFHFDVTIPFEDTTLTSDELPDSRTFQFFALCRDHHRIARLPNWVSTGDAMRSLELGLIPELPPESDVLETDPRWLGGHDGAPESCVQIIDTERMPISCEATGDGVTWDTSAVPAGNYVIRGYTFAPAVNLWVDRFGVVQVGDGPELAPVVALVTPFYEPKAYQQSGYRILGCMGGPPGTTVTLAWAATSSGMLDDDATWTDFAELDAAGGEIDELLVPPESAIYLGLLVRGVARAPDGRTWTGYAPGFITVYPGDDASDAPTLPSGPDHCAVAGDTSGGLGDGESTSDDTSGTGAAPGGADDGGSGCNCRVSAAPPDERSWALALLVLLRPRSRGHRRGSDVRAVARPPRFVQQWPRR